MYYSPVYPECAYCMMRQLNSVSSFVRVLHASPIAVRVDVYANGKLIAGNLGYKEFTPYLRLMPGTLRITVYRAGTTTNPVIDTQAILRPNLIYTAAIAGRLPNIEFYPVPEPEVPLSPGKANIRFVHLSPNAPAVDFTTADGKVLFSNVKYRDITGYTTLSPGRYNLQLRLAGTNNVALNVPNVLLKSRRNYTVYAVGLVGERPELQVLIPLDGSTYLQA